MRPFRFGVSLRAVGSQSDWIAKCRRAEQLGYDVLTIPDHLGTGPDGVAMPEPFPALSVAATVTERVRVGPLVLNTAFYNPALLTRAAQTTHQLTGQRLDLGLGAGHMKAEFDDAGLPWWPASARADHLERTMAELDARLANEPRPPLLIAGNSDRVLTLAARRADIVGFAGLRQAPGEPPGTFHLADADEMDERVAFFRTQAGGRADDVEANMLIQHVAITTDRRAQARSWAAQVPRLNLGVDSLLATPQLLLGTVDEIVEQIQQRRKRYGFSYLTVFEPAMEDFAPVIEKLAEHHR